MLLNREPRGATRATCGAAVGRISDLRASERDRLRQMKGHGSQFGQKKERAIAALLTQRNLEEAAKATGISPNTLLSG